MRLSADAVKNKNLRMCIIVCKYLKREASFARKKFAGEISLDIFATCKQERILEIIRNPGYSSICIFFCVSV